MSNIVAGACWPCVTGLHEECFAPTLSGEDALLCCCSSTKHDSNGESVVEIGRPVSDPSTITDVLTTGRKRAAMLYPVFEGMICEWAGLRYAGGGVKPIIGCQGHELHEARGEYARHHGPDKNVLENGPANVHRICPTCHNRWHALNNEFYGERPPNGQPFLPVGHDLLEHDKETLATEEEMADNEIWWSLRKIDRANGDD